MRLPDHGIKCLGSVLSGGDDEFFHEDQKYEKGNSEIVNPKIANPKSQLPDISLLEFFLVWDFFPSWIFLFLEVLYWNLLMQYRVRFKLPVAIE